jgi:hypothetical protein
LQEALVANMVEMNLLHYGFVEVGISFDQSSPLYPDGCLNEEERRKDAYDREAIVAHLKEQLRRGDKSLVGNKGYRRYLKVEGESHFAPDEKQIKVVPNCPADPRRRRPPNWARSTCANATSY